MVLIMTMRGLLTTKIEDKEEYRKDEQKTIQKNNQKNDWHRL